jgi:hypothetical protein
MFKNSYLWCCRFKVKLDWFCLPPARRNTSKDEESEKVDKVLSALGRLGVSYTRDKPDLHYAIGHMRLWDGTSPPLANGTKPVEVLGWQTKICNDGLKV